MKSAARDRTVALAITVLLLLAQAVFLIAFFSSDAFFDWAFTRHQNTLSWIARPLLVPPYCFFAYRRSLNGILLTLLAILTSMFWFPAPAEVDPRVAEFLAMERERLQAGFDMKNVLGLIAVVAFLWALAAAFWTRSLVWGALVAVVGALGKLGWSVAESPESGAAIAPYALGGAAALLVALWLARRSGAFLKRR